MNASDWLTFSSQFDVCMCVCSHYAICHIGKKLIMTQRIIPQAEEIHVLFCRSLFVFLSLIFWPLYCLSFFDLHLLIIPFGILSQTYLRYLQTFLHICCYICWMVITTTIVWHLYIDLHMSCTTKGVSSIFARAVVYSIQL